MTKVFPSIPERFFHFSIKLLCSILSYCWVDSRSKFTKLLKKQMFWYNRNIFGPNCIIGQESSIQSLSWGRPRGRRGNPWWRTGSSPTNTWPCLSFKSKMLTVMFTSWLMRRNPKAYNCCRTFNNHWNLLEILLTFLKHCKQKKAGPFLLMYGRQMKLHSKLLNLHQRLHDLHYTL